MVQSEGVCCVTDSSVTFWHFEKQSDSTYYISTEVDGVTKYLTIGSSYNAPVALDSAPQSITVTEGAGDYAGMVRLTANGQAVNLYSGLASQGFGSWNDSGANEWQTLCKAVLLYDLAVSTQSVGGHAISGSWENTPELTTSEGGAVTSPIQTVTQDGVYVYSPGTPGEDGYFTLIVNTDNRQEIREKLGNAGKEFRFDGWAAEDIDGTACLFSEGAEASLQEDGIHITDVDGVERTLSPGTTLTAQWTEVSDIVLFFVNYSGTILDTEGNVSGRNQKDFTGIIAIGRIYYGKQQAGQDDVFGNDANKSIRIKFTNRFNPDDPETQVVMAYVTAYDEKVPSNDTASDPQARGKGYNLYSGAEGINDTELEKALLAFIQANDNVTIKVSTADNQNNPEIENENATPDNYSVRWYVMKEQTDGWHIDGVMVAKTQEVTVTKTFSGLTPTQVETLLNKDSNDGYAMPVKLGVNRTPYIIITTQDIDGQYAYYGQEKTGGQSYTWTLNAITDEQYTLSEENYELDGYDVSSVVVHYYKDEAGDTQISYQAKPTTEGLEQEMVGGITTAVSFNNFYTKTGTGAFAVHKSADNRGGESDVGSALQGAVFALYTDEACETPLKDDNNMSVTSTTNSRGSAYFGNLSPGTYYMKETQAPEGYLADETAVWKVLVAENGTEETSDGTPRQKIKVTVSRYMENGNLVQNDEGVVCYDDGIQNSYSITNTPLAGTVRVTKTFEGLTALQMEAIVKNSTKDSTANPYYIKLQGTIGSSGIIDANDATEAELYLQEAARSQDGFTFTWMVTNLAMTDQNGTPISYQISEHNYLSPDYMDTVVTMAVNGVEQSVYIDRQNTTADISKIQFNPDISDTVLVTNRYINTFDLKIQKVDSSDPDRKLADATFKIYGPYRQSTDTSDQKVIDGATYYYIGSITTDDDGVATHKGLSLSGEDSATFVYYLSEWEAPDGYVTLEEPIYVSVTVRSDGTTDGYDAGILTLTAENTKEENFVHRTLDAVKLWSPGAPSGTTVTLELYRVKHYERNVPLEDEVEAELVGTVTLDGTADEEPAGDGNAGTITAYESAPWTATWLALPSADADNYNSDGDLKGEHYHYFVRENVQINGFTVSYACADTKGVTPDGAVQTLRTSDGQTFQGVLLADMDEAYTVTITNTGSYTLPKSGGTGTTLYTTGGLCLLLGSLLYGYRLRRARERRSKR